MKKNNYDLLAVNFINAVNKYEGKVVLLSSINKVSNINEYYDNLLRHASLKDDKFLYVDMSGESNAKGIYDYIHGSADEICNLIIKNDNIYVLPCGNGNIGLNEVAQVIESNLLENLAENYDKVFVNLPSLAESAVFHSFEEANVGVVFTVNKTNTRASSLKQLIEKLNETKMQVLGIFIAEKDSLFVKLIKKIKEKIKK